MSKSSGLPARPDLNWYKKSAKKRLKELRAIEPKATLSLAQLRLARELGFGSWRELHQRLSALRGDELQKLSQLFVNFAEQEAHGSSELYERLTLAIARDAELLALAGLGKAPIPNLFLAAVHFLLMNRTEDPLAKWYPDLNASPRDSNDLFKVFKQFCLAHRAEIAGLMRTRIVQTNEIARCGYLRAAVNLIWEKSGRQPLALIEVGTSAGLNLCFDSYSYDYGDGVLRGDPKSSIKLAIELRGDLRPPIEDQSIDIRRRIGIDLNPIRPDSSDVAWLKALIWPEHQSRRERLDQALQIVSKVNPDLRAGDASELIEPVVRSIPQDTFPCIFQTHALNQFPAEIRDRFLNSIESLGAQRPLAFLSRHAQLTLDFYDKGHREQLLLAECDAHGRWIQWLAAPAKSDSQVSPDVTKAFADAMNRDRGDIDAIRKLITEHPEVVNCHPWAPKWSHNAMEAVAHMCVWHRPKMHEIAKLLIANGAQCDFPTVARAGLLDEVKRRLDADPSLLDKPDKDGRTAIYRAACTYGFLRESIPVVQELRRRGATIDIFTASSWLMLDEMKSMLAKNPQAARAKDSEGLTALHWVTRTDSEDKRQIEAAKLLLDAGADLEAAAEKQDGMRPLHTAAEWPASVALVELFLDYKVEVNSRTTGQRWTALDFAIDRNRERMRDFLKSRGGKTRDELDTQDTPEVNAFLNLVNTGDPEPVAKALDANPSLLNSLGKHPQWGGRPQALHIAIERGNQRMFDLLIARGANVSGENALYDHWSPLMLAIHWKRDAMRDELLKRVPHVSLIDALMKKDDARALQILAAGSIMLQRPMPNDATMLHFCTSPTVGARLLELGVRIDAKDKYGRTALDTAAANQSREMAQWLIEQGAQASPAIYAQLGDLTRLEQSLPPGRDIPEDVLKSAIQGKHAKIVRWLIKHGADVNQPDKNGVTPLHAAAWEGDLSIVKILVQARANARAQDGEHHSTPADWARHNYSNFGRENCLQVAEYLEGQMKKKWSVESLPEHRKTHKIVQWKPIMDAAFNGDAKEITRLIKSGVDPNVPSTTPGAQRPLHRAMEEKVTAPRGKAHEAAVKALLAGGADPQLRGGYDRTTALQTAAMNCPQFIPLLVESFKPLDIFHACVLLDLPRVKALLKKNPSLATSRDANLYTPLHYVAASKLFTQKLEDQLKIAQLLLENGADVGATFVWAGGGDWPIPVLYMACGKNNNPQLTELLLKAGAQPYDNESIYHAADEDHQECLAVLEKYADKKKLADEATMSLRTQMHWGKSRGAKWLLEHGADPNSLHVSRGNSALHSAVLHGSSDKVIELLLKFGADPKVKNRDGKSAVELAKASKKDRILKLLSKK